jgi:hypothetical protein
MAGTRPGGVVLKEESEEKVRLVFACPPSLLQPFA